MDELLKPLVQYGTDHLEPSEKSDELRTQYFERLRSNWLKRGNGISHDAVEAIMVMFFAPLFIISAFILYSYLTTSGRINPNFMCFAYWGIMGLFILVNYFLIQGIYSIININKHTISNTFRKYPIIRKASRELADTEKSELLRDYLPILHVEGKKYILPVFYRRADKSRTPTSILVLDEQGKIVRDVTLMEKAYLTAFMGIVCGHIIQKNAMDMRRDMNHVISRRIPDAIKRIERNRKAFKEHGLEEKYKIILSEAEPVKAALKESATIIDGENKFRKAMGYAFAVEFFYEDALQLRELYLSYVRYLNATYRKGIINLSAACAQSISIIQTDPSWGDRPQLLQALAVLAVAGPNGVLSWIWQREFEGTVNDEIRKKFNDKTIWAKNKGWPVAGEGT
jgi:hypothetical protein